MLACPRCGSTYQREVVYCGLDGEKLVHVESDPLLGRTIDRYAIEGVLGDGGMARVYRARHVHLAQPFAVKVLFGDMASDRGLAERFRREAMSAAQIKHPNVVAVTDFGVSPEGLSFMAMELLTGPTLNEVRRQGPTPLTPARIAALMKQIVAGLGAAHALGFVHRDLKPKNIMVVNEGITQLVKILDFGLVRTIDTGDARLTQQGQIFGTPAYMAPEQISEAEVDARTDLYALGAILYELLSGRPPFVGTMTEIFRKHLYEAPAPLSDVSGLGELAMVLLSKEKNARPRGAQEVLEIIDSLGLQPDSVLVSVPPALAERRTSKPPVRATSKPPQPSSMMSGLSATTPRPASRRPSDLAGGVGEVSPAASAAIRVRPDDSLGIRIGDDDDSIPTDDRAIERMAADAKPSIFRTFLIAIALGAAAVGGWRVYTTQIAPVVAPPPPVDTTPDAAVAAPPSPTPTPTPVTKKKKTGNAQASAAASAAAAAASAAAGMGSPLGAAGTAIAGAMREEIDVDLLGIPSAQFDPPSPAPSPTSSPSPSPSPSSSPSSSPAIDTPPIEELPPIELPPPAETGPGFGELDRDLRTALARRDLNLRDLEGVDGEAVLRWRTWRSVRGQREPAADERKETYDALTQAIALASADMGKLLAAKRDRIPRRISKLPPSPAHDELAAQSVTLEDESVSAGDDMGKRSAILTKLTALELRVDQLAGEE